MLNKNEGPIHIIKFDKNIFLKDLIIWNRALWNTMGSKNLRFDFTDSHFFTPMAMIFISHQIRLFRSQYPNVRMQISGYHHLGYPAHMGFFKCFGADIGKDVGEASGDINYLPLTYIKSKAFISEHGHVRLNEAIEIEAGRLATVLTQFGSGSLFSLIQYSLREVIRNVFEHSSSSILTYCAQYWPSRQKIQIAIVDEGVGIHRSLQFNPRYKDISERDSLHLACMPGVSGNYKAITDPDGNNPWRNSGYGLYMLSRLCRNSGGFLLMSSDTALVLGQDTKRDFQVQNFRGTLVRLDLDIRDKSILAKRLDKYATEGKELAKAIRGAQVITASSASQMLYSDFKSRIK